MIDMELLFDQAEEKWESILNGGEDLGIENCSFCRQFFTEDCEGCPIAEFTNKQNCYNTPYFQWDRYQSAHSFTYKGNIRFKVFDEKSRELAEKELEFIKQVREHYWKTNAPPSPEKSS